MILKTTQIAEIQGLYGPVAISEKLLQKIWLRGDFNHEGLETVDGQPLKIFNPGTWNLQEGPDFKNAEIEIAGQRFFGDVEIHFYGRDWSHHGHSENPEFDRVVLHVVLFASKHTERPSQTSQGSPIPTLILLPWLYQDLEEYATEEALLTLENRGHFDFMRPLLEKSLPERHVVFYEKARQRWEQKVQYAGERLSQLSWEEACHQSALEVLGYRRNRAPMLALATRFSLASMAALGKPPSYYFRLQKDRWKLAGLRPANHPLRRLQQYLALLSKSPCWPESLRGVVDTLKSHHPLTAVADPSKTELASASRDPFPTASFRRLVKLKSCQRFIFESVLQETLSGSRLDTLVCDAFLPLLSAETEQDLFPIWFHWFPGDLPDTLRTFLKQIEVTDGRVWPSSNGFNQGALKMVIEGAISSPSL